MAKWSSQGAELQVDIGAGNYQAIPHLDNVPHPEQNDNYEDTTDVGSTGQFAEYTPTFADPGEFTVTGFWDPANAVHDFLMDEAVKAGSNKVLLNFKSIGPTAAGNPTSTYTGYVKFSGNWPKKETGKFSMSVRVTGQITYAQ